MLHIAICEDEELYLKAIQEHLQELAASERYEIFDIHLYSKSEEQKQLYAKDAPKFDVIFMDIELKGLEMSGIELSKRIHQIHPLTQIIFITQYEEYCSDVYEEKHVYFIHKPKMDIYMPKALEKVIEELKTEEKNFLHINYKRKESYVPVQDILYLERNKRITTIYCTGEPIRCYETGEKLSELIERLGQNFIVCHRSYAVNISKITGFEKRRVRIVGEMTIPIGNNSEEMEVKQRFAQMFTLR